MPHTDMTEKGLETIMVEYLRNHNGYEQGSPRTLTGNTLSIRVVSNVSSVPRSQIKWSRLCALAQKAKDAFFSDVCPTK